MCSKFCFILLFFSMTLFAQPKKDFAIAIHGGAGTISKNTPDSIRLAYENGLTEALQLGVKLLKEGKSALDVAESVVRLLEDNPLFNAGKGAVFTANGTHELDASIMDGKTLQAGAVAGVTTVKNPISLARKVMSETPHVLLVTDGAEQFADKMKVERVSNEYFNTENRYKQWLRSKETTEKKGTVGCVVLDLNGNLAAATSTGGMTNKMAGRVGDTPIIGAGNYANNASCAVSGTGTGEQFIRHSVAFNISAGILYKNLSLDESSKNVIFNVLNKDDGGVIAVDKFGNISMPFNSLGMFRGAADSDGKFFVRIWED